LGEIGVSGHGRFVEFEVSGKGSLIGVFVVLAPSAFVHVLDLEACGVFGFWGRIVLSGAVAPEAIDEIVDVVSFGDCVLAVRGSVWQALEVIVVGVVHAATSCLVTE
jgi:hypothetical protein